MKVVVLNDIANLEYFLLVRGASPFFVGITSTIMIIVTIIQTIDKEIHASELTPYIFEMGGSRREVPFVKQKRITRRNSESYSEIHIRSKL